MMSITRARVRTHVSTVVAVAVAAADLVDVDPARVP